MEWWPEGGWAPMRRPSVLGYSFSMRLEVVSFMVSVGALICAVFDSLSPLVLQKKMSLTG